MAENTPEYFRAQIARIRRVLTGITDQQARAGLRRLAETYEARAAELERAERLAEGAPDAMSAQEQRPRSTNSQARRYRQWAANALAAAMLTTSEIDRETLLIIAQQHLARAQKAEDGSLRQPTE